MRHVIFIQKLYLLHVFFGFQRLKQEKIGYRCVDNLQKKYQRYNFPIIANLYNTKAKKKKKTFSNISIVIKKKPQAFKVTVGCVRMSNRSFINCTFPDPGQLDIPIAF